MLSMTSNPVITEKFGKDESLRIANDDNVGTRNRTTKGAKS